MVFVLEITWRAADDGEGGGGRRRGEDEGGCGREGRVEEDEPACVSPQKSLEIEYLDECHVEL